MTAFCLGEAIMSSLKLYECSDDVCKLLSMLDEGEDVTPDTIEMVIGDFKSKAEGVIAYLLNMQSEEVALEEHIKKMQLRKRVIGNKCASIKNYLFINMQRTGIKKIDASNGSFTAFIRKTPGSVEILDEEQLPEKCIKTTRTPDKTAIKTLLKAGVDVPGAKLTYSETLNIR